MSLENFSLDYFNLTDKVAIVTGGNTGLGQGYAVALAKAGANVFVVTHNDNWKETQDLIEATGRKAHFKQAELTDRESIKEIVEECVSVFGRIDILVNNAGTIRRAPLLEYKEEDWNAVMDINLNAVYFLSQEVAKVMVKQESGKIINISLPFVSAKIFAFSGVKLFAEQ